MKKNKNRYLAILLTCSLSVSMMPSLVYASAAENQMFATADVSDEISDDCVEEPSETNSTDTTSGNLSAEPEAEDIPMEPDTSDDPEYIQSNEGIATVANTRSSSTLDSGSCGGNMSYVLYDDGRLVITGEGNMTNFTSASAVPWYNNRATVSNVSFTGNVTSIGNYAFDYCTDLTSITIPDTITSIGAYAFYGCSDLSSITIPESVTSIGKEAFSGTSVDTDEIAFLSGSCGSSLKWKLQGNHHLIISGTGNMTDFSSGSAPWYDERKEITTVILLDGVTGLGAYALAGCTAVTSVTFADTVTTIGTYAFAQCTGISEVDLSNITEIGAYAFAQSGLTKTKISSNNTITIGNNAFADCTSLETVTLERCTLSAGDSIWKGCTGLKAITFSAAFEEMGSYLFAGCTSLSEVSINKDCTDIGSYMFSGCTALEDITIPDGVEELGSYAFQNCTGITEIKFPDTVTTIQTGAFSGCSSLESIQFSKKMQTIEAYAFCGCTQFTSMEIPDSVTSIGNGVFSGCSGLESLTLPFVGSSNKPENEDGDEEWEAGPETLFGYVFGTTSYTDSSAVQQQYSDSGHSTFYLPDSLASVTITGGTFLYGAFDHCSHLEQITIQATVTSIPPYAFRECTELSKIELAGNVTEIGTYAFSGCSSLSDTTSLENVQTINRGAFSYCTALETIELPQNLTLIADETFRGCSSLTDITIPENVQAIGKEAFRDCTAITNISLPANLTVLESGAFYACTGLQQITLVSGVTEIQDHLFYGCTALEQITIKGDVTSIGNYAFADCIPLKTIPIPDTVSEIGNYAFYNCKTIQHISLPKVISQIGNYAFGNCVGLTTVKIPEHVTSIGSGAFSGCSSLQSMTLPFIGGTADAESSSAATLFGYIFGTSSYTDGTFTKQYYSSGTGNGATYYIPNSLTDIEITGGNVWYGSFYGCTNLKSIRFCSGESVTDIGAKAFYECTGLESITLPDGVQAIGAYAFSSCTALENIYGMDNLEIIGEYAFQNCSSLTSIIVPDSVTAIGSAAFSGCGSLQSMTLPFVGSSSDLTSASANSLFGYIFGSSTYTGAVSTAQSYSSSGKKIYYLPESLKKVTITGGNILYGAFYNCSNLTSLTLPDTLSSVGEYAFYQCLGLTEIRLPADVTSIGAYAFANCSLLKEFSIPSNVSSIESYTFSGCTSMEQIIIPDGVTVIGTYAFKDCSSLTSIIVPDSVTKINSAAFSGCSGLQNITLPFTGSAATSTASATSLFGYIFGNVNYTGSVATVQYYADNTSRKATYYIPKSLKNVVITSESCVPYGTFYNCTGLTNIIMPDTLTEIGSKAFFNCTGLSEIIIPQNITTLGTYSFSSCTGIQYVTFSGNAPNIASTAFTNVAATVFYPESDSSWDSIVEKQPQYGGTLTWLLHTHRYQSSVAAPTCTEQGYTIWKCSGCSSSYRSDFVNALGHTPVTDSAVQATCTKTGLTEGSHCSVCGEVLVAQSITDMTNHLFATYISNEDATYEQDGTKTAQCKYCGETDTITDSGSILIDKNKPTVEINVGTNYWTEFFHSITFGLFYKETQSATIQASDAEMLLDGSTVDRLDSVYYYLSDTEISYQEFELLAWNEYTGALALNPDKKYIIYAKAVDKSNNITYASSTGMIVDETAPVINGISDGGSYCEEAIFTVKDLSIQSVTDNGSIIEPLNSFYSIEGDDKLHNIVATDNCGNTTKTAIIVNKRHAWNKPVFSWDSLYKRCTAEYTCSRDESHVAQAECTVQAQSPDATCTTAGSVVYTATAILDGIVSTDSKNVSGVALGHNYVAEFTWATDHSNCTVTLICQREGCTDDAAGHLLSSLQCFVETRITEATCISEGKKEIIASLVVEGVEYTDIYSTEIIPIDSDKHINTRTFDSKEATCLLEGATGNVYCMDCYALIEPSQTIPTLAHIWDDGSEIQAATCSEAGIRRYTCTNGCGTVWEKEISTDETQHGYLYLVGAKEATATEDGYTGDTWCKDCNQIVATGSVIPATGNNGTNNTPGNNSSSGQNNGGNTPSSGQNNGGGTSSSGQNNGSTSTIPAKGTVFTVGKLKYKVTNSTAGKRTVDVQGPKSKKVTSLTIPAKVKKNGKVYSVISIGANAFRNCSNLKKITIGKNVISIGANAFRNCSSLKKITLGKNVTSIGKNAFYKAKKLKNITILSAKITHVRKNALKGIHKKAVIRTPKKKLTKYRKLFKNKGQKKTVQFKAS